jgi:RNA polymerase sigma-70 factor (ECF subfamily)
VTLPLDEALLVGADQADEAVSRALVRSLMVQLPPEYQTVLDLHIVQGYSRAETGRRMDKSEAAVRGLLYRGLKALRELMRQQLEEARTHEA